MTERRSLIAGLTPSKTVERAIEEQFVFAEKAPPPATAGDARTAKLNTLTPINRVPLTVRFRADLAASLKRASLERQLHGISPNTLQDILDEAVQPWLQQHGYLT